MPTVIAPSSMLNVTNNADARNPTNELRRRRFRHADAERYISATAKSVNATMTSRRMPVIPYTLRALCLWREFPLLATFPAHRPKGAHEALQVDHIGGRRGGHRPVLLHVHGAGEPGMHRVRGVPGSLQLRHRGRDHGRGSYRDRP